MTLAARRERAARVRGRRAGIVTRILAGGIDLVVTAAILFGLLLGFSVVRYMAGLAPLSLPQFSGLFTAAAFPAVEVVYLAAAWSATGRSVGNEIVGLRVLRGDGARLGRWRATARAVFCTAFGGPSLLWAAVSSRNAAVHDLVLRTVVVHDWSDAVRTGSEAPSRPVAAAGLVEPARS